MNPLEALSVLFNAAGLAPLNRADHAAIIQAYQVLQPMVQPEKKKEEPAPPGLRKADPPGGE